MGETTKNNTRKHDLCRQKNANWDEIYDRRLQRSPKRSSEGVGVTHHESKKTKSGII